MDCAGIDIKAQNQRAFYAQIILSCVSGYRNVKWVNELDFCFYHALIH